MLDKLKKLWDNTPMSKLKNKFKAKDRSKFWERPAGTERRIPVIESVPAVLQATEIAPMAELDPNELARELEILRVRIDEIEIPRIAIDQAVSDHPYDINPYESRNYNITTSAPILRPTITFNSYTEMPEQRKLLYDESKLKTGSKLKITQAAIDQGLFDQDRLGKILIFTEPVIATMRFNNHTLAPRPTIHFADGDDLKMRYYSDYVYYLELITAKVSYGQYK